MEDKLESKTMEAPHPKHLDKKTDEVTEVNQVIPLNTAYERAGLTPPVPLNEMKAAISGSNRPTPPDDEMVDPLIGNRVAGYVVEETISAGGMGVVYRARQPDIGRCVAIKVLRPEIAISEEQSNRFFKEAQALSAIRHRGVTDIIQWGRLSDKRQYIVMEYLEGDNLEDVMGRDGAMPVYRVLGIIGEVLDALSAAHKVGVVHRDLKPSNIFIAKQSDGTQCVKLLDFGLARQVPKYALDTVEGKLEKASMVAGTPEYIAPEQARGLAATPRTDIYSLGVLTFEMLAGKLPFQTQSTVEMMKAHAYSEAPNIQEHAENIPSTLAELLTAMLKKLPEERPRGTDEVKQRLHRISQQLKDAETHVAVRIPRYLTEEPAEQPKKTKLQKLRPWWPIVALPLVAGLGMLLGRTPSQEDVVVSIAPVVDTPVVAPVVAPLVDVTPPDVTPPSGETLTVEDTSPPEPVVQPASPPVVRPSRPTRTPVSHPVKPDSPAVAAPAVQIKIPPVSCSQSVWPGAMTQKLSACYQQLTSRLGDKPEVKKKIASEYKVYQNRINNNDGTAGNCEHINNDLDNWLKAH